MADNEKTLSTPVTFAKDKLIVDEVIISPTRKKFIIVFRLGRVNTEGYFVDAEEYRIVRKAEDFQQALNTGFGSLTNAKAFYDNIKTACENFVTE